MAEAEAFGKKLESDFAEKKGQAWVAAVDWNILLGLALTNAPGSDAVKADFKRGAVDGIKRSMTRSMDQIASYRMLRAFSTNGETCLVFRMISEDDSLNYHYFYPTRSARGLVRGSDIYVAITGERFSETFRSAYLQLVAADKDRSFTDKLKGSPGEKMVQFSKISEITKALQRKDYAEALSVYHTLPKDLQKDKKFLMLRLQAAMQSDDKEYLNAIALWETSYPGDPSLHLVSIDGWILRTNHVKVIDCIRQLDSFVGGDPYLGYLESAMLLEIDKDAEALKRIMQAWEQEPDLEAISALALGLSLKLEDHPSTVRWLDHSIQQTDDPEDFTTSIREDKDFDAFLKSEPGKAWSTKHSKTPSSPAPATSTAPTNATNSAASTPAAPR